MKKTLPHRENRLRSTAGKSTELRTSIKKRSVRAEDKTPSNSKRAIALKPDGVTAALVPDVFHNAAQPVTVVDADFNIVYANPAYETLSGYELAKILGKNPFIICSRRRGRGYFRNAMADLELNGCWQGEIWCARKNGEAYPIWAMVSAVKNSSGIIKNYTFFSTDITKFKQNEERLQHMAHYDVLTNLPNRSLMFDRLNQVLRMARRYRHTVSVMLLDLDRFKEVNDTLGHHVGDRLLIEVSQRLVGYVRESDTVARLGGDEFLIILPEVRNPNNAVQVAQKFIDLLSAPFEFDGNDVYISVSIGIAMYPGDGEETHQLVKNADTAMYHAKAQGKNNFKFFTEDINKSTIERFLLETRFRRALEKLEFQLNYQPKVDIRTGSIIGMEALLRWYHPEQGHIDPRLFIPLAEETGLIVQLGEWVIREACRQIKRWQDEGLPHLRVSVNISARHFHRKDLAELIVDIIKETGLASKYLMLEITESMIMENVDEAIMALKKFKNMGISTSIDDFGTGYSSLNYLKRFSIDELKIDGSFIKDIEGNSDNRKVISAIIALAHSLNLSVVAEGVETKSQLDFLTDNGCDEIQGYYFSKPLSSEAFKNLIQQGLNLKKVEQ